MKNLILLLILTPILSLATNTKPYCPADSIKRELLQCQVAVIKLDARLTTCEQALADSAVLYFNEKKTWQKTSKKLARRKFWKGISWGILTGLITSVILQR